MNRETVWTFVVDYDGGTYVSQFSTETMGSAIEQYNEVDQSGMGAIPLDMEYVAITGVEGVFCVSGLSSRSDSLILANIVKTRIDD